MLWDTCVKCARQKSAPFEPSLNRGRQKNNQLMTSLTLLRIQEQLSCRYTRERFHARPLYFRSLIGFLRVKAPALCTNADSDIRKMPHSYASFAILETMVTSTNHAHHYLGRDSLPWSVVNTDKLCCIFPKCSRVYITHTHARTHTHTHTHTHT